MTKPLQLDGLVEVESNRRDDPFDADLRKENARLGDQVLSLRRELEDALSDKERLERTVRNLQTTLGPIHRALSILFGEMELAVGEAPAGNAGMNASAANNGDPRWESYKDRFPGVPAKIIDALLTHGEMKVSHLIKFVGAAHGTVYNAGDKLQGAGAITRNGGIWSLKR